MGVRIVKCMIWFQTKESSVWVSDLIAVVPHVFTINNILTPLNFSLHQEQETPLHCAAWHGYYAVAKSLCEAGCDVHIKNKERETPLLTAAARGYVDIVECLMEHCADMDAIDTVSFEH